MTAVRAAHPFGSGGSEAFEAGTGAFVFVPAGAIHREANPTSNPSTAVVVRAGAGGDAAINVDGPA